MLCRRNPQPPSNHHPTNLCSAARCSPWKAFQVHCCLENSVRPVVPFAIKLGFQPSGSSGITKPDWVQCPQCCHLSPVFQWRHFADSGSSWCFRVRQGSIRTHFRLISPMRFVPKKMSKSKVRLQYVIKMMSFTCTFQAAIVAHPYPFN